MSLSSELIAQLHEAVVTVFGVTEGGGFFVKCGDVITSASLVKEGPPAARYWVQVRRHQTYLYEALLIGLDRPSGIAILRIEMKLPWNANLPPIKSVYLRFGSNRCVLPGSSVYIAESDRIRKGFLQSPSHSSLGYETVITDIKGTIGYPLLDGKGQIIALDSMLAQHMAEPIIRSLLQPDLHTVTENNVVMYRRGYLGLKLEPLNGSHLLPDTQFKQITGWVITDIDASPQPSWQRGDLLVNLNNVIIGTIPPTAVLWNLLPGMTIMVMWRSRTDGFATCAEAQVTLREEISPGFV